MLARDGHRQLDATEGSGAQLQKPKQKSRKP